MPTTTKPNHGPSPANPGLTRNDKRRFRAFRRAQLDSIAPTDATEAFLAETIVFHRWFLLRADQAEAALMRHAVWKRSRGPDAVQLACRQMGHMLEQRLARSLELGDDALPPAGHQNDPPKDPEARQDYDTMIAFTEPGFDAVWRFRAEHERALDRAERKLLDHRKNQLLIGQPPGWPGSSGPGQANRLATRHANDPITATPTGPRTVPISSLQTAPPIPAEAKGGSRPPSTQDNAPTPCPQSPRHDPVQPGPDKNEVPADSPSPPNRANHVTPCPTTSNKDDHPASKAHKGHKKDPKGPQRDPQAPDPTRAPDARTTERTRKEPPHDQEIPAIHKGIRLKPYPSDGLP